MSKPLVSIIIVNWNGGEVFENCLKSLSKIDYPNWELIVVDNGSTDGSEKLPQNYKSPIRNYKLIKNKTNLGFALPNNQGYKRSKGRYILLLNNDTKVSPDFLNVLVEKMEKEKELGVVQPKIFVMDRPKYLDNAGSFLTRTGFLQHWGFGRKDGKEFNTEREIFSAKGACMLIRRELIEKTGLFDEEFVSYMEESDFCWRAWLLGYKVKYYPKTHIYHKVGMTSKRMSQIRINYHSMKNRIASLHKNLEIKNLLLILGLHTLLVCGLGFYYLLKLQLGKAGMIFKAILWDVRNLPKLTGKRKAVQKLRVKTDREIFESIMRKVNLRGMFSHFKKVEANF